MSNVRYAGFRCQFLDADHQLWEGCLPEELGDASSFEKIWNFRPDEYHDIRIHGKWQKTPRWQQAYNRDYKYTGSRNNALPVPEELQPYWDWARDTVDPRLNGLLLNWYDGSLGHYIGKHRDKADDLVHGSPIVTISLGEARKFRLRPWRGKGFKDFAADNGSVFILPFATNETWTHEVPASRQQTGKRISVTLRVFEG